ncbi:type VI secretion system membrane subunit TssM [Rhodocyclus purpureus]|uniref:type VI secretion system membrane subunit TssM n=1 Tax=Rhodocyclus purpureus TaxID=1067 RepID=UPI001912A25D|nr:type VI secretion system membrane subunit TssM [Rhodocyclus purpureus]
MKKILALLTHPVLLAIVGLLALAALIWFVGPLVAIDRFRPLESATVRWLLIALIFAAWLLKKLWDLIKARQLNTKLLEGLRAKPEPAPATPSASEEEVARLNQRFDEAIGLLKEVRISAAGRKPGFADLVSLAGRQYLYQLPWYIFIGAPGSGKTTALINSGLQFPLADKFGTASIKGVGGTRNCDWWFTDEAILLDTAGRYTTQESDREVDRAAWQGFLDLLKRSRPRQPINGVMLTVSVSDLLLLSPDQRQAQADAVRQRLQELHERFRIRFPIYVLVTKTDLLAGFTEFFADLGKEERAQVWGSTFAWAEKAPPSSPPSPESFAGEFDALEQRLLTRVNARLHEESDPARRAQIFAFPQQFSSLRPLLLDFLGRVFSASKFEEAPLLRGVYFTSGTQEGSPIDRVLGSLARAFRVERKSLPPQASSGRSYFITRVLRDLVFHEQGLAGRNLRVERQRRLLQLASYGAAGLLLLGAALTWLAGYAQNGDYVAAVEAKLPAVRQQIAALPQAGRSAELIEVMPVLDAVRRIAVTPAIEAGVPTTMGFGLYQGEKLDAAAGQAYARLLEQAFLPRLALRVEEQLRSANANNLEFAYEALKAYLMLHESGHFDAEALKAWIRFDWERSLPREITLEQRQALAAHLDVLFARGPVTNQIAADQNLVASVRNMLARYPLADRVYSRLKRQGVGSDIPEFTLVKAGGPSASLVFTRPSGKPLTSGVPGLFTYDGYHKAFKGAAEKVANQLADEEAWVLGTKDGGMIARIQDPAVRARLDDEVRRLYLEDYARTWEAFLGDVKLVRTTNLQQAMDVARLLSAIDNPLAPFLRAASHETTLQKTAAEKTVVDQASERLAEETRRLSSLFGGAAKPVAEAGGTVEDIVDRRFEDLRRYVTAAAPGQPAPVDGAVALVGELYTMLSAADTAIKAKTQPPPSDVPNKVKAQAPSMPEPLRAVMQNLAESSARQAGGAIIGNVAEAMQVQVGDFCRQAIAGRYPLVRSSNRDATQDDFATLFAPGGKMDQFFQQNLAPLVDTTTRPWSYRKINDIAFGGSAALVQFQRAQKIREVFFPSGGRTPGLKLEFKPVEMDATINQFILDVDGQLVRYSHGPQVRQTVVWPGPAGSSAVRVQIQPPGPTGVSGMSSEGPWALFRLFDKLSVTPTAQPERVFVSFNVDGRKAQFEVIANSVQNPFRLRELEQFRCP